MYLMKYYNVLVKIY